MKDALDDAVFFQIVYNGKTAFYGIVDEYEVNISTRGITVLLTGRGMGGRMIDRRNESAEYSACTIGYMLRNYVLPCGVTAAVCDDMPAVYGYSVSVNTSCLVALEGFTRRSASIAPRFNREGRLVLSKNRGDRFKLNLDGCAECTLRGRRYGVLSEVKIVTADGVKAVAQNEPFIEKGGFASAVVTVPRKTSDDMIRYTGKYQIESSQKDVYSLEITLPELFCAYPMDIFEIDSAFCQKGDYRVTETCCFGGENGVGTVIKLVKEES